MFSAQEVVLNYQFFPLKSCSGFALISSKYNILYNLSLRERLGDFFCFKRTAFKKKNLCCIFNFFFFYNVALPQANYSVCHSHCIDIPGQVTQGVEIWREKKKIYRSV